MRAVSAFGKEMLAVAVCEAGALDIAKRIGGDGGDEAGVQFMVF